VAVIGEHEVSLWSVVVALAADVAVAFDDQLRQPDIDNLSFEQRQPAAGRALARGHRRPHHRRRHPRSPRPHTASSSRETACAKSPPIAPSLTSPRKPESTSHAGNDPGRLRSEQVAAFYRNAWPRSIGTPAAIIGIRSREVWISILGRIFCGNRCPLFRKCFSGRFTRAIR
jgi:hypothetical protein